MGPAFYSIYLNQFNIVPAKCEIFVLTELLFYF
jgi:hypothetical protein